MSLANKYRPKDFSTVIGQDHITSILKAKMSSDKGGHSNYLLFGPRGTGKTTSARILAKAMNCLDLKDGNPCNTCANCQTINEGKTLDYVEIDAASHTGVDNIREEILDKVPYPPTMLKKKVYVIDEVHMLSKGAFNALLKTIEEPKPTVAFILATTEIHKVPETIISRCQVFNFKKIPQEAMVQQLANICTAEGITFEKSALEMIAHLSEGCDRDAIKYVDQVSILGEITEEHVSSFLGVASATSIQELFNYIQAGNYKDLVAFVDGLVVQGIDLHQFAKQVLLYLDEHLLENPGMYVPLSSLFSDILAKMKFAPHPALAYKMVLYQAIAGDTATPTLAPSPAKLAAPAPKVVHVEKPTPVVEQPVTVAPVIQTPPVVEALAVQAAPAKAEIQNIPQGEHSDLWQQVLGRIQKESITKSLRDHVVISRMDEGTVHLTVINKMTQMILEKQENMQEITAIFADILGKPTAVHVHFQNKDEFFENSF